MVQGYRTPLDIADWNKSVYILPPNWRELNLESKAEDEFG